MSRFIAFDVETPNRTSNRMSAIGITVIEDCKIVKEFYSLVNPETYFDYFNIQLTGISEETVWDAPTYPPPSVGAVGGTLTHRVILTYIESHLSEAIPLHDIWNPWHS